MKQPLPQRNFSPASLRHHRSAHTVLLRMAADAERAARIRALKESRPDLTWPKIAEACHVSPRSVALWAQKGTISYENTKPLAELFGVDRDVLWAGPHESPDVMGNLNVAKAAVPMEPDARLDRIEAGLARVEEMLQQVLDWRATAADYLEALMPPEAPADAPSDPAAPDSEPESPTQQEDDESPGEGKPRAA